jgi:hypothetical protein
MNIINIADPENPTYIGGYAFANETMGIAVEGDIAGVVDGTNVYVLDVSDPTDPILIASHSGLGFWDVAIDGEYLYVGGSYGFYVFRLEAACGDANLDGNVDVGDAVYIINYVFLGGPPPPWICKADTNGDGDIDVGDAVYVVNYVFRYGPPPAETCCDSPK